jgi:hypothetical protein
MSTTLRIEEVTVGTDQGESSIAFTSPLTVLAGPVGVGKSTFLELVKFGFGGEAVLAKVVSDHVDYVKLRIKVGNRSLTLQRSTHGSESGVVQVVDLNFGSLGAHRVKGNEKLPDLGRFLMDCLRLPTDVVAAARGKNATRKGAIVSFYDVLNFVYTPQARINQAIAKSDENYYAPKRLAVLEILFGLTTPRLLELRSSMATLRSELELAERDYMTVVKFLSDSKTTTRDEAQALQTNAEHEAEYAQQQLEKLQGSARSNVDRETRNLTDMLISLEEDHAALESQLSGAWQTRADFERELEMLLEDGRRLERIESASGRIAAIEFATCPRCNQKVRGRDVPPDHCLLCLQPDTASKQVSAEMINEERVAMEAQRVEVVDQIAALDTALDELQKAAQSKRALADRIREEIDQRTREFISPRLQAFVDLTERAASASRIAAEMERVLLQWDRAADVERIAIEKQTNLSRAQEDLQELEGSLVARRQEIATELSEEFSETVAAIGIPGVQSAAIDPESFLPVLNGKRYEEFSPAGGGIRTTTQVAYWVTLLTVAIRRRDTDYPTLLILDSPRLSLNNADSMAERLYRRLVRLADAAGPSVQIIVADNSLPPAYRQTYEEIDFDFENPTIATVPHPGPENVQTIES